ncbi:MAG: STM4012 family radical SAM protein [Planctomycetes bacterium]|nr:STM4012 family radical SAM protein [Planctomycetota bacterium]
MMATQQHPILDGSPYQGYVYAYPHKTAYRRLDPLSLTDVWADEPKTGLFLYLHVPFCTMRCGFCNLFTTPNPKDALVTHYIAALRRQAECVKQAIPDATIARCAIGGGTPTYLDEAALEELFSIAREVMGSDFSAIPVGIETSPDTITPGKIQLLKAHGVNRVSIGVQSFLESETASCGRPQSRKDVATALSLLAEARFPTLNIDLIYGLPGQTVTTWLQSLHAVLAFKPQELYLYPLYVRPLTGLGQSHKEWDDVRLACYREGRELLLAEGYSQVSMRMFRRYDASEVGGPTYCCQEDGMIGLGCGARSYTRSLHYSLDYAVKPKSVKEIIADYVARTPAELSVADHGFALNADEQHRRYLLQSLLNTDGLDTARYTARFGTDATDDFPELRTFAELGLFGYDAGRLVPTPTCLERSDAIGPWFFSTPVRTLMEEYEAK